MQKFSRDNFNIDEALKELMYGSGVIVIENVYNLDDLIETIKDSKTKYFYKSEFKSLFFNDFKTCFSSSFLKKVSPFFSKISEIVIKFFF